MSFSQLFFYRQNLEFLYTKIEEEVSFFWVLRQTLTIYFWNFLVWLYNFLSQAEWGERYITASMRKVDLVLEFNSFSSSNFLSRLVLQVISVPFVV